MGILLFDQIARKAANCPQVAPSSMRAHKLEFKGRMAVPQ
jgi:hypothetical protein